MSDNKLPYYKWYPRDYLSDENVALMTLEEEGAYRRLIDYCWIQESIPADLDRLARLCRVRPEKMEELWPSLEPCFRDAGDGRLVHPRLDQERRQALEKRRKLSEAGKKGRRKQLRNKEPGATPGPPPGNEAGQARAFSEAETETETTTTAAAVGEFCERTGAEWRLDTPIDEWADEIRREPKYAGIDYRYEIKKCADWHVGKNRTPKAPDMSIRNWLERAAKDVRKESEEKDMSWVKDLKREWAEAS